MTAFKYGSATDVGVVRANNEDTLLVDEVLFAVADGMGGHAAGEVASLAAVEALRAAFAQRPHTVEGLIEAVRVANSAVWDRAADDPNLRGMGTTLTVVALVEEEGEEHVAIANVGDSRAYLMRDGELGMLTDDHSVAEQLVREGRLTPEEAAVHPQRHVLTRVLGMAPEVEVDCYPILPFRGDRYLLCSDGLVNEVADDDIASTLRRVSEPQEAVNELVAMAREAGGHDNITIVLVDVVDDDDRAESASAALANERPGISVGGRTMIAEPIVEDEEPETSVAPAPAPPPPPADGRSDEVHDARPRPRRVTIRVALFLLLLVAILGGSAVAVGLYARASYFVGIDRAQVTIFKGRPGGLLWFKPTIEQHTTLAAADIPPTRVDDVKSGKEVASLAAARRYVNNLEAEHNELSGTTTTTTATTVAPATAPSSTTTTVVP